MKKTIVSRLAKFALLAALFSTKINGVNLENKFFAIFGGTCVTAFAVGAYINGKAQKNLEISAPKLTDKILAAHTAGGTVDDYNDVLQQANSYNLQVKMSRHAQMLGIIAVAEIVTLKILIKRLS